MHKFDELLLVQTGGLPEVEGQDVLREELARSILNLADLGIIDAQQLRDSALIGVEDRLRRRNRALSSKAK